ncbi:MAG: N-acetylmuramoyl-L-alanine amidase [Chthoniobacteraceae bacterium]
MGMMTAVMWKWLGIWEWRTSIACVGLVVLAGCLTVVIAPDPEEEDDRTFPLTTLPAVIIDAGHGGTDSGAKYKGVAEKDLTLDTALRLEKILNARGFPTVQTRTEDIYVPLSDRATIANRVRGPALFVSIHFNQGSGNDQAGIETFYADSKVPIPSDWSWMGFFTRADPLETGEDLAARVQMAVVLQTGAKDRGIRARHLYVTRHTRLPAVLVEGGFITNRMESDLLKQDNYADRLAEGIADGIEAWWRARHPMPQPKLAQKR